MVRSLVIYTLSFSLLAASLQVPVFVHTCHLLGVTETSLYEAKNCCGEGESDQKGCDQTLAFKCCSLEVETYKADLLTDLAESFKTRVDAVGPAILPTMSPGFGLPEPDHLRTHSPPIRAYNRTLLHFIQVLRL